MYFGLIVEYLNINDIIGKISKLNKHLNEEFLSTLNKSDN